MGCRGGRADGARGERSADTGIDLSLWIAPGAALVGATVASEWWPA